VSQGDRAAMGQLAREARAGSVLAVDYLSAVHWRARELVRRAHIAKTVC
jgi:hypothetical protein